MEQVNLFLYITFLRLFQYNTLQIANFKLQFAIHCIGCMSILNVLIGQNVFSNKLVSNDDNNDNNCVELFAIV